MPSRKIEDLTPILQPIATEFVVRCKEAGIDTMFTCTARSFQEQVALYAQGRQELEEVNRLRKIAFLPPINAEMNKREVTWTLASKHIINLYDDIAENDKAHAFDIVVLKNGKAVWDVKASLNENDIPDYAECGAIGKSLGLFWGGDFVKNKDYPHFELPKVIINA